MSTKRFKTHSCHPPLVPGRDTSTSIQNCKTIRNCHTELPQASQNFTYAPPMLVEANRWHWYAAHESAELESSAQPAMPLPQPGRRCWQPRCSGHSVPSPRKQSKSSPAHPHSHTAAAEGLAEKGSNAFNMKAPNTPKAQHSTQPHMVRPK